MEDSQAAAPGPFYVDPDCCMTCGVPEDIAPEIFKTLERHCIVQRQPCTARELDKTLRAMMSGEVDCIRYAGSEWEILQRLGEARAGHLADDRGADGFAPVDCDRVVFTMPDGIVDPDRVVTKFRADPPQRVRIGTTWFWRRTVRISRFGGTFHAIRFGKAPGGTANLAVMRPNFRTHARLGLAWIMEDWLQAQGAADIGWHTRESLERGGSGRNVPI